MILRQVILAYLRKIPRKASKQHSSMVSAPLPASSYYIKILSLIPAVMDCNLKSSKPPHKLLVAMMFITATENMLEQNFVKDLLWLFLLISCGI